MKKEREVHRVYRKWRREKIYIEEYEKVRKTWRDLIEDKKKKLRDKEEDKFRNLRNETEVWKAINRKRGKKVYFANSI